MRLARPKGIRRNANRAVGADCANICCADPANFLRATVKRGHAVANFKRFDRNFASGRGNHRAFGKTENAIFIWPHAVVAILEHAVGFVCGRAKHQRVKFAGVGAGRDSDDGDS